MSSSNYKDNRKEVLFICTGNIYRSRFAEAVFNYQAEQRGLAWRAFSRGLGVHLVEDDISPYARAALLERGIPLRHTAQTRAPLAAVDLERASRVIALKEIEHRPLMQEQFPDWVERIEYWAVSDLDEWEPDHALGTIETAVLSLLTELEGVR